MSSHSRQSTEHSESPLAAEEWQLRILWELHEKQPRPTVKQRRLLAAETGLDAKWIARWFKRANGTSKRKHQNSVGCSLSRSQTAAAMAATPTKSIDGKSANLVAEPTASGTSPNLFGAASELHTFLSTSSGVVPESGRSATGPYRNSLAQSWELEIEHPAVAPADLQANREHPISYPRANPAAAAALPQPHPDLVEHSQQSLRILTSPVHLASPFRHGTSSSSIAGTADAVQSIKSRGPHTSPSPGPLQTRYAHLNLVSGSLDTAYTESGRTQRDLGPEAEAARRTQVDLSIPDLVAPQLGPSSVPLPNIYWFLFDMDHDSVDQQRDDVSRSSSRPPLGMMAPHVTPTPVSFLAMWGDMLALERRIRSSSHNMKLVQSKQAQPVLSVEADRTEQGRRGEVALTETDRSCGPDRDRGINE